MSTHHPGEPAEPGREQRQQSTERSLQAEVQGGDLRFLVEWKALTTLRLSGCRQVRDFSPLAGLLQLTTLMLYNCPQVSDLSPLAGHKALTIVR
jgi:hypothetical protein